MAKVCRDHKLSELASSLGEALEKLFEVIHRHAEEVAARESTHLGEGECVGVGEGEGEGEVAAEGGGERRG